MPYCGSCGKKETSKRVLIDLMCGDCTDSRESVNTDEVNNNMSIIVNDDYWDKFDKRLDTKINALETKLNTVIEKQNNKIALLERKCETYEENIDTLKTIVAKQQRTIGNIDKVERERNIIISGLSEETLLIDEQKYETDEQKVNALFKVMDISLPYDYELLRLGKANTSYHRTIKMNVFNKHNRDEILKKTSKLKNAGVPWDTIYIKKDLHPALVQENHRLRIKKNKLKELEENKDKNITLDNGKLKINDVIVDKNMFFP